MTEPEFTGDEFADDEPPLDDFTDDEVVDDVAAADRDPGADVEIEGLPEVADESTPGMGDVPEPELPATPNESPGAAEGYGTTPWEQAHPEGIEQRVAAEVPDDIGAAEAPDAAAPENAALHIEDDLGTDAAEDPGVEGGGGRP